MGILYTRNSANELAQARTVRVLDDAARRPKFTPTECLAAYDEYTAKKLKNLDLSSTHYVDPSGYAEGAYTTPADLLRLGLIAAASSRSIRWWGGSDNGNDGIEYSTATVNYFGDHAREVVIRDPWRHVAGARLVCKAGSVSYEGIEHRSVFQIAPLDGQLVAIAIMVSGASYCKQLPTVYVPAIKTMLREVDSGDTATEPTALKEMVDAGGGYVACYVPNDLALYQRVPYDQLMRTLTKNVRRNDKTTQVPGSTTKIMTLLNVLDTMTSELDLIEIVEEDITDGSGMEIFVGDQLTLSDALYVLMRNSSNTMATALARYVGQWLLERRL